MSRAVIHNHCNSFYAHAETFCQASLARMWKGHLPSRPCNLTMKNVNILEVSGFCKFTDNKQWQFLTSCYNTVILLFPPLHVFPLKVNDLSGKYSRKGQLNVVLGDLLAGDFWTVHGNSFLVFTHWSPTCSWATRMHFIGAVSQSGDVWGVHYGARRGCGWSGSRVEGFHFSRKAPGAACHWTMMWRSWGCEGHLEISGLLLCTPTPLQHFVEEEVSGPLLLLEFESTCHISLSALCIWSSSIFG